MGTTHPPMAKAKSFTDLIAWREGHQFVLLIYKVTKKFPKEEIFCLTAQLRRAVISITSNIAEGFRRQSKADKIHFYTMALSSLAEVQNQSLIARDIGYLASEDMAAIVERSICVGKLLNALISSIKHASSRP